MPSCLFWRIMLHVRASACFLEQCLRKGYTHYCNLRQKWNPTSIPSLCHLFHCYAPLTSGLEQSSQHTQRSGCLFHSPLSRLWLRLSRHCVVFSGWDSLHWQALSKSFMSTHFSGVLITCDKSWCKRVWGQKPFSLWPNMVREDVLLFRLSPEVQVTQSFTLSVPICDSDDLFAYVFKQIERIR